MLTDCNLNAVMWITSSKLVPQFKNIIQNCEQLRWNVGLIDFNCTLWSDCM